MKNKCNCGCACKKHHKACGGGFWFVAWLMTVGILDLGFWHGVWAIIAWPFYIGKALTHLL